MFVGGFFGFAGYCCLVMLSALQQLISRGSYDWEGVVKAFFLPLGAFLLFSKETWRDTPLWVNLYSLFGATLIIVGICIGAWKGSSRAGPLPTRSE